MDSNNRPDCFWRADLLEAATDLVAVIREVKPTVAVTYDDFGGYGHPTTSRPTGCSYALSLAAVPSFRTDLGKFWQVQKVYWTAMPKGMIRDGIRPCVLPVRTLVSPRWIPRPSPSVSRIRWSPRRWTSPTSWIRRWMPCQACLAGTDRRRFLRAVEQSGEQGDGSRALPDRRGCRGRSLRRAGTRDGPVQRVSE